MSAFLITAFLSLILLRLSGLSAEGEERLVENDVEQSGEPRGGEETANNRSEETSLISTFQMSFGKCLLRLF